jgi:glycosyltransferase involved in cell wall biosynthesis
MDTSLSPYPRVSVLLPFYNAAQTLPAALDSIAAQRMHDFECILINNGSTDASVDIAHARTRYDPRFRLVHEPRRGVAHATNTGMHHSRGIFCARMDADDVAHPHRLGLQARFLDTHAEYGAVAGLARYVSRDADSEGFRRYVAWSNSLRTCQDIFHNRFVESPVINPTTMWRRTTADRQGLYRAGAFPEDYEMWLRWLHHGVHIAKPGEYVLDWYDAASRITRTHTVYRMKAFYEIKAYYLAAWLHRHNPHHPYVTIWGSRRRSRRRARMLERHGIRIAGYIDIRRYTNRSFQTMHYQDIPPAGTMCIISYVDTEHARPRIRSFLQQRGYCEGTDFFIAA